MNNGKVVVFIDSAYEEEFRKQLEEVVDEYFVIPKAFAYSRRFQPMYDTIVWPGYVVAIFTKYNDQVKNILEDWGERLKGKAFAYFTI